MDYLSIKDIFGFNLNLLNSLINVNLVFLIHVDGRAIWTW